MNRKHGIAFSGLMVLAAILLLAGCGSGTGIVLSERAQVFAGGALSAFGGADGADTGARGTARDLCVGREYDLTPAGFVVGAGAVTTSPASASARFSGGSGVLTVDGNDGTLAIDVASLDLDVTDIQFTGYFSVSQAQRAVEDSGASFVVLWEIEFTEGDESYMLQAEQLLSGTNWIEI